jgi:hypothetical protein
VRIRAITLTLAIGVVPISCDSVIDDPPSVAATKGVETASSPTLPPRTVSRQVYAIWPHTDWDVALEACRRAVESKSWRTDPEKVALRFTREELGWSDAEIVRVAAATGVVVIVRREPRLPLGRDGHVWLHLDDWNQPGWRCYSIGGVTPIDRKGRPAEFFSTYSIRGGRADVSFDLRDATSAIVRMVIGDQTYERKIPESEPSFRYEPTKQGGFFLVLIYDEDRKVTTAGATTFSPPPTAAG